MMLTVDSDNSKKCRYVEDWLSSTPSPPQRLSSLSTCSASPSSGEVVPPHIPSPTQLKLNPLKRKRSECDHENHQQSPFYVELDPDADTDQQRWRRSRSDVERDKAGQLPTDFSTPILQPVISPRNSEDLESSAYSLRDMELSASSLASVSSITSKANLKSKLEALQFNCMPAFTFHEMPSAEKIPSTTRDLLAKLSLSTSGARCIPFSLKSIIESDPKLVTETIPPFMWASPNIVASEPSPADLVLWQLVQDIVKHTALLSRQNAEESEYYPLVQKILAGSKQGKNTAGLIVKQVTTTKFNAHHLPQDQNLPSRSGDISPTKRARRGNKLVASGPILDTRVDISIEHEIPTVTNDSFSLLPFSLLTVLKRNFGSAWGFGPYPNLSLVTCVAEVKTPVAPARLEAEFQAAVGGACMIAARLELVEMVKACANSESPPEDDSRSSTQQDSLLQFSFPVITLVILGDTWYLQIVYLGAMTSCMVLPPRFAGETATHIGVFKLLSFVDSLRNWCIDVYAKEFTDLLKALGRSVGWRGQDE